MESWKMSIFKRQTSPRPPSYRRSLSEPAYAHSEIGRSLKSYPWRGPVKSKRKKNEQAVSSLGKPLGAYRWQTHPSLRLKGGKKEQLENNKGDLDEPQQAVLPKMVGDNISSSGNEVLGTSMEKQNLVNTLSLRVPFSRSLSEPEPRSSVRFVRRWPTSVGSVESEQQGYFIRGIFSTLSNGFSRMLSLKGESTSEPVREAGEESACDAGDLGLIPGSGISPGEGNGNPLQYSCLENPMDGGAWWATSMGLQESDMT